MPRLAIWAVAVWAAAVCAQVARAQPQTWEYAGRGQWPQVRAEEPATQSAASGSAPTLDRAEQLLRSGKNQQAEKLAVRWTVANKQHPQRDRGLFLIARALYQRGNRIRSFYYLDQLLDEYPDSPYFARSLNVQYAIADDYLRGYRRRFLWMPAFHAYEEAVEMLYRIQNRSPGSPLAEKALLRTADFYFADRQYDFAADTYGAYMRSYPRSSQVPRARLRQALASYAQFRGPRFDATPVIDAREQLRSLIASNPDLAKEENVPALLAQIDRDLARKVYLTADFYRRTNEPRGAVYMYRYVAKAFPELPEAQDAKDALAKMPQWALANPTEPAVSPEFAPGTPDIEPPRLLPAAAGSRQPQSPSRRPETR